MISLRRSSLFQLTATRFLTVLREPEAVFWVFVFPILLAVGLGIAFRSQPAPIVPAAATTAQLAQALESGGAIHATVMDEPAGRRALATGNILLLAVG